MKVKNKTLENYPINKSVQIGVSTPDINDGYILPSQTLELTKSISLTDLMFNESLKEGIYSGGLVFVIDGFELEQNQSIEIYDSGITTWAKIFNPIVSKSNLYEGLASGFFYVKNCVIG
tara:strand:+ start:172 stop:528 length:357 start_codon:yes stop_codon:yes gene_type:complete